MRITLQGITFGYRFYFQRITVLNDLDWELGTGITGLIGPNGAGKTTLMKILDQSLRASSGEMLVDGTQLIAMSDVKRYRRSIGIMPQDPSFVPWMSVYATLEYLAWVHQIKPQRRQQVVSELLERVGLESMRKKPVHSLSGGQKRRLAIACSIVGEPELLLLTSPDRITFFLLNTIRTSLLPGSIGQ